MHDTGWVLCYMNQSYISLRTLKGEYILRNDTILLGLNITDIACSTCNRTIHYNDGGKEKCVES